MLDKLIIRTLYRNFLKQKMEVWVEDGKIWVKYFYGENVFKHKSTAGQWNYFIAPYVINKTK